MSEKISQYTDDATSKPIQSDDYLDFSNWDGVSAWDLSKKIKVSELLTYLNTNISNFYNSDGTLDKERLVTMAGFECTFLGGTISHKSSGGDVNWITRNGLSVGRVQMGYDFTFDTGRILLDNAAGTFFTASDGKVGIGKAPNANTLAIEGDVQHRNIWFNNGVDRSYLGFGGVNDMRMFAVGVASDILRFDLATGRSSVGAFSLFGITTPHAGFTVTTPISEPTALSLDQNTSVIGGFTDMDCWMKTDNASPRQYSKIRTRITDNIATANQASSDLAFFTDTPFAGVTEKMTITGEGIIKLLEFTVATLPSNIQGGVIVVTDEAGGRTMATNDGANWLRVSDGAIVS